ncbi:hypothetical protein HK101_000835, partial [Irineochytrium annulatum]
DLENAQAERRHRKRGSRPELTTATGGDGTRKKVADPSTLRQRLLEKELLASENRAKAHLQLQSKLARHEERAKRVQERKRALGRLSGEDLNLSWGGEDGVETVVLGVRDEDGGVVHVVEAPDVVGVVPRHAAVGKRGLLDDDLDSGMGSSTVSLSVGGSRSGSGRSTGTNGEEGGDEAMKNGGEALVGAPMREG